MVDGSSEWRSDFVVMMIFALCAHTRRTRTHSCSQFARLNGEEEEAEQRRLLCVLAQKLRACVISVIINLICVFILQSNEHIEKLAHESDARFLFLSLSHANTRERSKPLLLLLLSWSKSTLMRPTDRVSTISACFLAGNQIVAARSLLHTHQSSCAHTRVHCFAAEKHTHTTRVQQQPTFACE